jgi:hypothetical protein
MDAFTMDIVRGAPGPSVVLLGGGHRHGERDPRLALFRQGRRADVALGSEWLARQAHAVSRPEVLRKATSDEVLGIGRAWKTLEGWTFARKLTIVRELIRRHPKDERYAPDACGLPGEWEPSLHHEIAAALGISVIAAGKLARLAWTLDTRLRGTGQALEDGRLDPARVKLIADETSVLEDEAVYPRAEQIILDGLPGCKTWGALLRLVQRAVITVDPQGAERRREQAEREHARLRFWRENSGTCAMQATGLPTDEALAANANIEARARAYKASGIARPLDILRVMAYLDLINGVTVAQRAAWAQADDAARAAEEADRRTRKDARDTAPDRTGHGPETDGGPNTDAPDGDAPDGPDGGSDGSAGGDGPGGPDGGVPSGDALDGDGRGRPGSEAPGDGPAGDGLAGPDGEAPDGGGHRGVGPDDDEPDSGGVGGPDYRMPGGSPHGEGPGGPDGDRPLGPDGGYPSDWPVGDGGPGDDGPDDGPPPEDPGSGPGDEDAPTPPCPQCGGAGGGTGLPVRASLTIPAGALEWLAEWSAGNVITGITARGPTGTGTGTGAGDGGHGPPHRGGPGTCPACGTPGGKSMPAREHLVLPLLTLTGLADRPGEAHGLGALDPGLVRDLAAAGASHPASQFCLTVTDQHGLAIGHGCLRPMRGQKGTAIPLNPDRATITPSGRAGPGGGFGSWILTLPGAPRPLITDIHPVPTHDCDHRYQSRGYQPSGRLRHLVQVRDGECSFPACSRHARESDFEHALAHHKGGRTCACNAHACSRSCHRAKQARGWAVTKPRPGWTQWTTRAGRSYVQGPWQYPV